METLPVSAVGREVTGTLEVGLRREWLAVDGTGSYACGTVAGGRTRRYHGLLVAALAPPAGRVLVCAGVDETAVLSDGTEVALSTWCWEWGAVEPRGFERCAEVVVTGTLTAWRWDLGAGVVLERRVGMAAGSVTTTVEYRVIRGDGPVGLRLAPLVCLRDHHALSSAGEVPPVEASAGRLRVAWSSGTVVVAVAGADAVAEPAWWTGMHLSVEAERGMDCVDAVLRAGTLRVNLEVGAVVRLGVGLEGVGAGGVPADLDGELRRQRSVLAAGARADDPSWVRRLVLDCDRFVVRRAGGHTVIAGYPWFGDWGRDTFIALPGLALATGRAALSASLLRTWAGLVDGGMIPNRLPDHGEVPEYNTVDATLWYIAALRAHVDATGEEELVDELWPVLEEIVRHHVAGTRHGIVVDPADGLLRAGEPGVQLTWMDAMVDGDVITPRIGKPVEVNALWHHALRSLAGWAATRSTRHDHARMAARVAAAFPRYWGPARGHLLDVLDGPSGDDPTFRANQVIAVSFPDVPVPPAAAAAVVDSCVRQLWTTLGMRTLDAADPGYRAIYVGDRRARDGAYHTGTAWPWLLGRLAVAHLRVHGDSLAAQALLEPLAHHVDDAGIGGVSEIADGAAPHLPRGCPWQAWSSAEALRSWRLCSPPAVPVADGADRI